MSNNGVELSKQTSPTRPRHHVSRSITDVSSHKNHRSHHHHIHRKDKDDKTSQSAHPNLQPNGAVEGLKSEVATPDQSRNASRRTSVLHEGAETISTGAQKRDIKEGEVKKEKEKCVQRATELRNVLMGLNTLSNNTTRKLDNTYYSVLEKLSILQSTIQNLKELALMTKKINEDFKTESEEIVKDVETQLDGFRGFEDQQEKIESLDKRIQEGRKKIKILAERVDVVRDCVEDWERGELEWQERTRRRLRLLWIIMSICATVLIAVILFQYTPARGQGSGVIGGLNASLAGKTPDFEDIRNETWNLKRSAVDALEGLQNKTMEENPAKEDSKLRIFDEL